MWPRVPVSFASQVRLYGVAGEDGVISRTGALFQRIEDIKPSLDLGLQEKFFEFQYTHSGNGMSRSAVIEWDGLVPIWTEECISGAVSLSGSGSALIYASARQPSPSAIRTWVRRRLRFGATTFAFGEGWWRRRESNPRPKSLSARRVHALSDSACFRLIRSERTRCA